MKKKVIILTAVIVVVGATLIFLQSTKRPTPGLPSSISGKVLGAQRKALQGVQVAAISLEKEGSIGFAETQPNGTYKIYGLIPGTYDVEVVAKNYPPARQSGVVVKGGLNTSNINFTLKTGGSISGKVTEADGKTLLKGKEVIAVQIDEGHEGESLGSNKTNADGTYLITNLSPGTYMVGIVNVKGADQLDIPVTSGQITSDVNFTLPSQ